MLILRVQGQLDRATVLSFRDAMFTAIGRRPQALLLDLRQLEPLEQTDSSGVSALLTVCRVARLTKIRLYVLPAPSLRTLLEQSEVGTDCLVGGDTDSRGVEDAAHPGGPGGHNGYSA